MADGPRNNEDFSSFDGRIGEQRAGGLFPAALALLLLLAVACLAACLAALAWAGGCWLPLGTIEAQRGGALNAWLRDWLGEVGRVWKGGVRTATEE